jgi:hypothetical protein
LARTEKVAAGAGKASGDIGRAAGRLRIDRVPFVVVVVFITFRIGDVKPFFNIDDEDAIDVIFLLLKG